MSLLKVEISCSVLALLACNPAAEPVCGDGELGGREVCDGAELGGTRCGDLDPGLAGALACAGDCLSFDASACEGQPSGAWVVLNEVTSKSADVGPYADLGDAIELVNVGGEVAELGGWRLSDDPTLPADRTYVFAADRALGPGEIVVLVARDELTGVGDLPFGLGANNVETVTLVDADGATRDALAVRGSDALVSYCRLPDGTGSWQVCDETLGARNRAASSVCGDGQVDAPEECDGAALAGASCEGRGFAGGALRCTPGCRLDPSLCQSGAAVAINELEAVADQIELFNFNKVGTGAVDLSGWILTDVFGTRGSGYDPAEDPERLVFPAQTRLEGQQFLVVTRGLGPGQHPFGLGAAGDTVTLLRPDLTPVSQASYSAAQAERSFCRLPDGPDGSWTADCVPTFGAANLR